MRVLVVGAGAREHALAWRLAADRAVSEVIIAPRNVGVVQTAERSFDKRLRSMPIAIDRNDEILALAERERVDLTVVGPEQPLERGLVDLFTSRGRRVFGPSRGAAALETSKVFAKTFMQRHRIPTARSIVCDDAERALTIADSGDLGWPVVVKADGLAAGKGVVIATDRREARDAVSAAMIDRRFGTAGARVVLEEYMHGVEASFFVICDGRHALPLPSAQDHKRIFDDDRGPNARSAPSNP